MAYCTKQDLIDAGITEAQLNQLSKNDDTAVAKCISAADSEIDGYVSLKYSVPRDPPELILKKLSINLAIYNLFRRKNITPDDRRKDYDNAIRLLESLARGTLSLGAAEGETAEPKESGGSFSAPARVFDRDGMKGF